MTNKLDKTSVYSNVSPQINTKNIKQFWNNRLWLICVVITIIGIFYTLVAAYFIYRFAEKHPSKANLSPAVTILKPLHGAEPDLYINLSSFCDQDYTGSIQIILGISNPLDPAIEIAKQIQSQYRDRNICIVSDPTLHGPNHKISNVINMFKLRQHSLIILSDSDIRVEKNYLNVIASAFADDEVGVVSFYYSGTPVKGIWSQLTACHINHHFFPSALFGSTLGFENPCFGSSLALSDETLSRIGGFENFSSSLADDYAIGQKVIESGKKIIMPSVLLQHTCSEETFFDVFHHLLRWNRTIRSINPKGHFGSLITYPLPFAFFAFFLNEYSLLTFFIVLATLACRMVIPLQMAKKFQTQRPSMHLIVLTDLFSFIAYLTSYSSLAIKWRGKRIHVKSNGNIDTI